MISYDLVIPKLNSIGGENTKKCFGHFYGTTLLVIGFGLIPNCWAIKKG
jgi:hypothetical protein